jgi:hypothetical protein
MPDAFGCPALSEEGVEMEDITGGPSFRKREPNNLVPNCARRHSRDKSRA